MNVTIKGKKELIDLASDFSGFVTDHNWISRYDIESDSLSVTSPKLSDDARIKYVNDEIAFYMTKDNKIEGVFVEYFKSNFIEHHEDLKNVLKDIEASQENGQGLVTLNKSKLDEIAPDLEEAIKVSLAEKIDLGFK